MHLMLKHVCISLGCVGLLIKVILSAKKLRIIIDIAALRKCTW